MAGKEESQELFEPIEWYLDYLLAERGASPHTGAAYRTDLMAAAERLASYGLKRWEDLTPKDLLKYEASLGPPLAQTTAQRKLSALRSFLKFLRKNGSEVSVDLPATGGFKKKKVLPKALTKERLEVLLNAPKISTAQGLRDRVLMELIYGAGLRVTEAVELPLATLDLEEATLRITGKRGKTRLVPLPAGTVEWLRTYLRDGRPSFTKKPIPYVLVSDRGKKLLRQTAYDILEKHQKAAGLSEDISPHTLRHTYAVHMLQGGADLRVVQELLGHESVATTQVYTQMDLSEVRRRYERAHPRP